MTSYLWPLHHHLWTQQPSSLVMGGVRVVVGTLHLNPLPKSVVQTHVYFLSYSLHVLGFAEWISHLACESII